MAFNRKGHGRIDTHALTHLFGGDSRRELQQNCPLVAGVFGPSFHHSEIKQGIARHSHGVGIVNGESIAASHTAEALVDDQLIRLFSIAQVEQFCGKSKST